MHSEHIYLINHTDKEFSYKWGGVDHVIEPMKTKGMPRYLAEHFIKHSRKLWKGMNASAKRSALKSVHTDKTHVEGDPMELEIVSADVYEKEVEEMKKEVIKNAIKKPTKSEVAKNTVKKPVEKKGN